MIVRVWKLIRSGGADWEVTLLLLIISSLFWMNPCLTLALFEAIPLSCH